MLARTCGHLAFDNHQNHSHTHTQTHTHARRRTRTHSQIGWQTKVLIPSSCWHKINHKSQYTDLTGGTERRSGHHSHNNFRRSIGTRQLMSRTSAERGGVCGAWLRQKYKPTLKLGLYFRRRQALWHAFISLRCVWKRFAPYQFILFTPDISARQRAWESVARRKMLLSRFSPRTPAIQPIMYRCHELSLQRIDHAITSESSHWTISSSRQSHKADVIAVKVQSWLRGSIWVVRSCLASQVFNWPSSPDSRFYCW